MLVISSIVALDLLALYYVLFEFFFTFYSSETFDFLHVVNTTKYPDSCLSVRACCGGTTKTTTTVCASAIRLLCYSAFPKRETRVGSKELASRVNHLNAQVGFYFIPVFYVVRVVYLSCAGGIFSPFSF